MSDQGCNYFFVADKGSAGVDQNYSPTFERNSQNATCLPKPICVHLKFLNHISRPLFTGKTLEKQGIILKVALVDTSTGNIVINGADASAEVEILLLSGGVWNLQEFNSIICGGGKDGTKSVLCGNLCPTLKKGVVSLGGIFFRHSSKHMRKTEFRLCARIVACSDGTRVTEAISEPFTVKDRRTMSKKRYPPYPNDEVWRLEKIRKGGPFHERLCKRNILTVKDFLTELELNPENLRSIMDMKSRKKWEVTVNHAQTCRLGYIVSSTDEQWDEVASFEDGSSSLLSSSLFSSAQNSFYGPEDDACDVGTSNFVEYMGNEFGRISDDFDVEAFF